MLITKFCTSLVWLCDKMSPITFEAWHALLIKYPDFLYGHIRFAELARQRGAFDYAKNSLTAAEILGGSNRNDVMLLAGRLALKDGDFNLAAEKFRMILQRAGHSAGIIEELVAALLPLGQEQEALALLGRTSISALTPEGQAIFKYLSNKLIKNV